MTRQFYLLRISAMSTADDVDALVPSGEILIDGNFNNSETGVSVINSLHALAKMLVDSIKDAPLDNVRPMTREEIRAYRDAETEEDDDTILLYQDSETRQ